MRPARCIIHPASCRQPAVCIVCCIIDATVQRLEIFPRDISERYFRAIFPRDISNRDFVQASGSTSYFGPPTPTTAPPAPSYAQHEHANARARIHTRKGRTKYFFLATSRRTPAANAEGLDQIGGRRHERSRRDPSLGTFGSTWVLDACRRHAAEISAFEL